jgi:hypothetical protein
LIGKARENLPLNNSHKILGGRIEFFGKVEWDFMRFPAHYQGGQTICGHPDD